MKMCNFLGISQDYGICDAFLRLKRWAILDCPFGTESQRSSHAAKTGPVSKWYDLWVKTSVRRESE